jgi:hypothetical protein
VIQASFMIIQTRLLQEATLLGNREHAEASRQAATLVSIAREIMARPVQELLAWLPRDGSWVLGAGPYADIISQMLDEGTELVEEEVMPEDGGGAWRVRLTETALKILAWSQA